MTYLFSAVATVPPDPILGITVAFLKDPREDKINLSVGIYKTEEGKTPILSSVKTAEKFILENEESKTYLPIDGDAEYLKEVGMIVLGEKLYKEIFSCLTFVQTLGGSGALRLGAEFMNQEFKESKCYIPEPTWPNHRAIFTQAGLSVHNYPYYDFDKKKLNFDVIYSFLSLLQTRSVIVFQANCHNPSGSDLDQKEWDLIADLCLTKGFIPFFDAAYLGFATSFEEDAFPLRLFANKGIEFLAAISFSKNFALYSERIGSLMLFSKGGAASAVVSQLKKLVRRNYSNPPSHGAKIIARILQTPSLNLEWRSELNQMKERINSLRGILVSRLALESTQVDYSYLLDKKGLFSFCNLSERQVQTLIQDYGVYMTSDGRMNIAGLNASNIDFVIKALLSVGG